LCIQYIRDIFIDVLYKSMFYLLTYLLACLLTYLRYLCCRIDLSVINIFQNFWTELNNGILLVFSVVVVV